MADYKSNWRHPNDHNDFDDKNFQRWISGYLAVVFLAALNLSTAAGMFLNNRQSFKNVIAYTFYIQHSHLNSSICWHYLVDYLFLHPAGVLLREARTVQSTQLNTTSGNSICTHNVQGPQGRDGRDGLPGRDGRDGVPGRKGERGAIMSHVQCVTLQHEELLWWFLHNLLAHHPGPESTMVILWQTSTVIIVQCLNVWINLQSQYLAV